MDGLLWLSVIFLVLALVAYILGATRFAGFSMEIAKWLVIIFVILAVLVILLGGGVVSPIEHAPTPVPNLTTVEIREYQGYVDIIIHSDKPYNVINGG